jgi:2-C-methyl-D-erythritol 2,4-cyclodiphosphate synthase
MRIGFGYDVHRLVEGRPLVIGGVTIPFEKGLQGHSDADVLLHAVIDALLGAAGLGDIGFYFPDTDPTLEGVASTRLLHRTARMVSSAGYVIGNIDAVVVAEAPPIGPHRSAILDVLSRHLGVGAERISIKATTTEGLGATGRGEAIAAMATVLILQKSPVGQHTP